MEIELIYRYILYANGQTVAVGRILQEAQAAASAIGARLNK